MQGDEAMKSMSWRPKGRVLSLADPSRLLPLLLVLALPIFGCASDGTDEGSEETSDTSTAASTTQPDTLLLYAPASFTTTYLVDASNQPVYQWDSEYEAGQSAFLLDDGSILRPGAINDVDPDNRFVAAYAAGHNDVFNIGGFIQRISKENEVEWSFEFYSDDFAPHHVVTVMPNGNLLLPVWRYHTREESLELGRDPKHLASGGLWIDSLVELRPTEGGAEVVWEWKASDHLIQDFDDSKANYGDLKEHPGRIDINWGRGYNVPEDFMHVNSAFYIEEYDQILLSSYHYSEIWVIDHSTTTEEAAGSTGGRYGRGGELLYRWGNPWVYGHEDTDQFMLSAVHDPKWLPESRHFILFDNNVTDPERDLDGGNSRVVEIAPPIQPDGSYVMEGDLYGPRQPVWTGDLGVQASSVGTAQRVASGNTLSCDCPDSEVFWFDAGGDILSTSQIWQNTTGDGDLTQVFRLVGYSGQDPGVLALGLGSSP
jgi:hypothetical protein